MRFAKHSVCVPPSSPGSLPCSSQPLTVVNHVSVSIEVCACIRVVLCSHITVGEDVDLCVYWCKSPRCV